MVNKTKDVVRHTGNINKVRENDCSISNGEYKDCCLTSVNERIIELFTSGPASVLDWRFEPFKVGNKVDFRVVVQKLDQESQESKLGQKLSNFHWEGLFWPNFWTKVS